jgi:uncharacterized protein (TIGR02594 family)
MARSTTPGILAFTGLELALPARTPGCLGLNDQGDPRLCTRLGDTPGCTGVRDGADASLPWWNPAAAPTLGPVRAADGTALALPASAPPLPPPERPPWMKIAEDEAREYKGETEETIQKTHNYATRVHTGQATMVGNDHPWCAAFVNWCLREAGVDIENPTFADHVAAKGRAHGFFEVKGERAAKGDKGIPTVRNPRFVMLEAPVFGAIAMVTDASGHGHHVGFVYSQPRPGHIALLGGNQSDRIMFQDNNITAEKGYANHLLFFLPTDYQALANAGTALDTRTADQLNKMFGISVKKLKTDRDTQ